MVSQLVSKVKKVVLSDDRVGKVAKTSYNTMAKATELFACSLFKAVSALAVDYEQSPKILKASHVKWCAKEDPSLGFLLKLPSVEGAPDFVAEEKVVRKPKPAQTKKRKAKTTTGKQKRAKSSGREGSNGKEWEVGSSATDAKTAEEAPEKRSTKLPPVADLSEDDDYDDL
ncbi:transcription factor CBF/NF-Y domain-containing protein [Chloropicon primus]|uniref:Transcription factor CBF/NF-Y/archaeal histone domain-containing protein n=1 Tax=Chloropicon primus TaxID=1764295 RepID=A0A5B8MTD3_9CHLO|nr:hypothetical protein A3770_11p63410 [Chloropicon primus]UPR03036.1 transcription factor CBF/NF-Y domain-containing protein [Chloropicon primus]|mmetsp:Transcript_1290/g.3745  ORF Transcript_1290/g.3745 Transcript_1290/m.3745 type:complete len:171 (+) Transcript_1290:128-640(+)|eukprot:QDZ23823.1 hypothetical protein A3770_11p63410 [Chloropicon primus]